MRTKARAILTDALRDAHRWLDELTTNPSLTIESLASREGKTERWIRRTLSLAFLCPALVKAAIDGRLPRGFGVKRLMDLPMAGRTSGRRSGSRRPPNADSIRTFANSARSSPVAARVGNPKFGVGRRPGIARESPDRQLRPSLRGKLRKCRSYPLARKSSWIVARELHGRLGRLPGGGRSLANRSRGQFPGNRERTGNFKRKRAGGEKRLAISLC